MSRLPTARKGLIALVALAVLGSVFYSFANSNSNPLDGATNGSVKVFDRACASGEGVGVVIDFGTSSKEAAVEKCLVGFSGTGWAALEAAGLEPEGTDEFPSGFVCRIAELPAVSAQDCADTPTYAEGNWAYYLATPESDGWMISGAGAGMRSPECGSVEGWRFIEGGESSGSLLPRVAPETSNCG